MILASSSSEKNRMTAQTLKTPVSHESCNFVGNQSSQIAADASEEITEGGCVPSRMCSDSTNPHSDQQEAQEIPRGNSQKAWSLFDDSFDEEASEAQDIDSPITKRPNRSGSWTLDGPSPNYLLFKKQSLDLDIRISNCVSDECDLMTPEFGKTKILSSIELKSQFTFMFETDEKIENGIQTVEEILMVTSNENPISCIDSQSLSVNSLNDSKNHKNLACSIPEPQLSPTTNEVNLPRVKNLKHGGQEVILSEGNQETSAKNAHVLVAIAIILFIIGISQQVMI